MNIREAIDDPKLFAPQFQGDSWTPWKAFCGALFGLELTSEELAIFQKCTSRAEAPSEPAKEAWLVVGRRGGKSRVVATIATYLATFKDWRPYLAPGENGFIVVIAPDRRQARTIMNYIRALLQTPLLAPLVAKEGAEDIELTNNVVIEVATCSWRTIRGRTVIAALADEVAFWRDENSANPDREVIAALKPAMATIPNAVLLGASSPYAKRGVLYAAHRRHYGREGPVLVWQADSRTMNPLLPQRVVDEAYEDDPQSAAAEYGGLFRDDIAAYVTREAVEAVVDPGAYERGVISGIRYSAFVDPSGGVSDAMTLAISHAEGTTAVLDVLRERKPPFSPDGVSREFSELLKAYGIKRVTGDRYSGEWVRESFRRQGITYDVADRPKSDIYRDLLPAINSGAVRLLDNDRLVAQLCGLERRTSRGGRDSIDHAPNGHDDLCNAAAGALIDVSARKFRYGMCSEEVVGDPSESYRLHPMFRGGV